MKKFILKRLLWLIPVLIGVDILVFTILYLSPTDPTYIILGSEATVEMREEVRHELGLDQPYYKQYLDHLSGVLRGDFGESYKTGRPVVSELGFRVSRTLIIAIAGSILAVFIGLLVGLVSAAKQYSVFDYISVVSALFLAAIPSFFLAMILVIVFALNLGWLPASGVNSWKGYILPSIICAVVGFPSIIRMTRSSMLEVLRQDYIRTIRAKGASERYVLMKHALKNALLPIITVITATFGNLLGGAVISETVFAIAGVGTYLVEAVRGQDRPSVMVAVLFIALCFGIINLITDLIYAYIDPRIKSQFSKG